MTTPNWIARSVSKLRTTPASPEKQDLTQHNEKNRLIAPVSIEKLAINNEVKEVSPGAKALYRSTTERLKATFKQSNEALSPRALRRTLDALRAIIDPQVSEVEGGRRAQVLARWYAGATLERRRDIWLLMSEQFLADPVKVKAAQAQFASAVGTPDEAVAEVHYRRATVSPRRRLLQRFSAFPEGIRFLVDMRADMLPALKADKRLQALDVEMEYMYSTWFDVGFLELRRISWDSPASLIEKLIKYEAVHDIKGWADVKNRLDSDRRCYAFFHPRLPGEPLIFVEVALVDEISRCITPLLDESADASDLSSATTAIFYSISNTQGGLRGVSFGDSLIKRVVETLKDEFPRLKVFSTLSPVPGFRAWLGKNSAAMLAQMSDKARAELGRAVGFEPPRNEHLQAAMDKPLLLDEHSPVRRFLLSAAAHYLGREMTDGKPTDPVARFHLGNGARIEQLNWAGDPSSKGLKQSYGLMVNYLYDLKRLDKHRAMLYQGKIPVSSVVERLMD
jgi:malonyl-CoA decarboxylase